MVIIENAMVWSGDREQRPSAKTLVVENDLITKVVDSTEPVDAPSEAVKIDADGCFVLPGLINSHIHICLSATADAKEKDFTWVAITAAKAAEKTLCEGITTVRDLGAPGGIDIVLRDMIRDGSVKGPGMVVSGRCLCMTGGHGHQFGLEVDGPDEARKGARLQLKHGADMLKVMATGGVMTKGGEPGSPQLTVAEMTAVVEEAEKKGTVVSAHAHGTQGIINAVTAGVLNIEHGTLLDERGADLMAAKGAYYTPTFISAQRIYERGIKQGIPDSVRKVKQMMKPRRKSLKLAINKGLKILLGSDAGTPGNPHGMESLLGNMLLLQKEGMDTRDILFSATGLNAEALGLDHQIGKIEPGYQADIIAVKGNPFDDLEVLNHMSLVLKGGKVIRNKCVP